MFGTPRKAKAHCTNQLSYKYALAREQEQKLLIVGAGSREALSYLVIYEFWFSAEKSQADCQSRTAHYLLFVYMLLTNTVRWNIRLPNQESPINGFDHLQHASASQSQCVTFRVEQDVRSFV
jgi:hypothetical protein